MNDLFSYKTLLPGSFETIMEEKKFVAFDNQGAPTSNRFQAKT